MDFKAFDKSKLDEYSRKAKELYGDLPEYKEMQEKQNNRTEEDEKIMADRFMLLFKEAGEMKEMDPSSPEAQNLVKRIQEKTFIPVPIRFFEYLAKCIPVEGNSQIILMNMVVRELPYLWIMQCRFIVTMLSN